MENNIKDVFEMELKCWCFGLDRVGEQIEPSVIHKVIKELTPVLHQAVLNLYAFDAVAAGKRIGHAGRNKVCEKEITFSLLSHLPCPTTLDAQQTGVLERIVDETDKHYPGARIRMEKKWRGSRTDLRSLTGPGGTRTDLRALYLGTGGSRTDLQALNFPVKKYAR